MTIWDYLAEFRGRSTNLIVAQLLAGRIAKNLNLLESRFLQADRRVEALHCHFMQKW